MSIIHGSINHTYSGRKRKVARRKNVKKTPSFVEYKPSKSYAQERADEAKCYPSCVASPTKARGARGDRRDSPQYTGTYVIGIATMHKSNAVPVTNKEYATDISKMSQ